MVPSWVPAVPPPADQGSGQIDGNIQNGPVPASSNLQPTAPVQSTPVAPAGRFHGARLNFGKFACSDGGEAGSRYLQRGLRNYVRKGYGGRANAVKRFGGTASTAASLYGALSSIAAGQPAPGNLLDPTLLEGRSAREVMDAIVEATRPIDGTQDAEASRCAIKDALSELLTVFPEGNLDLRNLTEDQRTMAIELYVAFDVYKRVELDIGKVIGSKAPTAIVALSRLKEVKDYIRQTVNASFRKLRNAAQRITTGRVNQVVLTALEETFKVFEEYR